MYACRVSSFETLTLTVPPRAVPKVPCGAVHAVAAGEGGARAKVVSLAPARVLVGADGCAVPNFWYF